MKDRVLVALGAALAGALVVLGAIVLAPSDARQSAGAPAGLRAVAHQVDAPGRAAARRALILTAAIPRQGYRVTFAGPRARVRAQIDRRLRLIQVFVRPGEPAHRIAHDLAHELGHAYDDVRLDDAARRAYLTRRGAPRAAWWPKGAFSDLTVGAGDFAEVFARCHVPSPDFRSRLRRTPADACAMLPSDARPR